MRKLLLVVSYIFIGLLILVLVTHDKQTTTTPVTPPGTVNQTADDPEFFTSADDSQFTRCGGALAVEDLLSKKGIHVRTWCSKNPDTLIVDNTTLEQDHGAYQLIQRKDLSALIVRVGFTKVKFAAAQPNGRLIYTPPFLWDNSEKRFSEQPALVLQACDCFGVEVCFNLHNPLYVHLAGIVRFGAGFPPRESWDPEQ